MTEQKPIRRATKFDGYFLEAVMSPVAPEDWKEISGIIAAHREKDGPFDFVQYGVTPGNDPVEAVAKVAPYQEVGVTWWMEGISPYDCGFSWGDAWTPEIVEILESRVHQDQPKMGELIDWMEDQQRKEKFISNNLRMFYEELTIKQWQGICLRIFSVLLVEKVSCDGSRTAT